MRRTVLAVVGIVLLAWAGRAAQPGAADREKEAARLTARLKSAYWPDRYRAAESLRDLGVAARSAVPALVEALGDEEELVRFRAAQALGQVGPAAREAVLPLRKALLDTDRRVREAAAVALAQIGPSADELAQALHTLTEGKGDPDGKRALGALAKVGPADREVVPLVLVLLNHPDSAVRTMAAEVLGQVGPAGATAEVVLALLAAQEEPDWWMKSRASGSLRQIDPDGAILARQSVPALSAALLNRIALVRAGAARELGKRGPAAREAVPALLDALKDREKVVRAAAAEGLGGVRSAAERVVPALATALGDHFPEVRAAAARGLGQFGPAARPSVSALAALLQRADPDVQVAAAQALGVIGPAARDAGPALLDLRESSNLALQTSVKAALTRIRYPLPPGRRTSFQVERTDNVVAALSPDCSTAAALPGTWAQRGRRLNGVAVLWALSAREKIHTFVAENALAFAAGGEILAAGAGDAVALWDVATGKERGHLSARGRVASLVYAADGKTLAALVFREDRQARKGRYEVQLWRPETGEALAGPDWRLETKGAIALSADGKVVAVAGPELHLWDLAARKNLPTSAGHAGWVECIAFAADGRTLASAGQDGTIRLWETATGKPICRLASPGVVCLTFSPDGQILAAGDADGVVTVWESATRKQRTVIRSRSVRGIDALVFTAAGTLACLGRGHPPGAPFERDQGPFFELEHWDLKVGH
jgi:HEAT repeat protein